MRNERNDGAWFAPKRFGYGAGLPIAWQGWMVLGLYIGLVMAVMHWRPHAAPLLIAAATLLLGIVAYRKTRGGWRWRGWR